MNCDTCEKSWPFAGCDGGPYEARFVAGSRCFLAWRDAPLSLSGSLIFSICWPRNSEPVENLRLVCGVGVSLAQVTWRTTNGMWPLISSGSWIEMHAHIVSCMYSICRVYVYTYAHHSPWNQSQVIVFPLSYVCHHPLLLNLLWHTKVQAAACASLMKVGEGVGRRSTRGFLKLMDFGERKGYMVILG